VIARALAFALLALVLAAPASAGGRSVDARERAVEGRVMCPTCHQLLSLSHSPVAERIRRFIRLQFAAGKSTAEVERELVAQFGPAVLASPPARGFGLLAWLVPVAGLLAAAAAVAGFARAWRRRALREPAAGDLAPDVARRVARELLAFDE
jgi:cytochrome c-type biogenesis protein CcmH/NrfF